MAANLNPYPRWYALTVKPRHEKAVAGALRNNALEEFLPLYRSRRVWSDRIKELDLPLFPGYVFCRFSLENRGLVLKMSSVISIVGFGNGPTPVADREMINLKNLIASGFPLVPWPFLKVGEKVRIERGPLQGLEGILLQVRNSWRVIVSVFLLRRSVAVEVDGALVSAVRNTEDPSGTLANVTDSRIGTAMEDRPCTRTSLPARTASV